jgi:glycosyltransferase involved in cell wall biosynthesis
MVLTGSIEGLYNVNIAINQQTAPGISGDKMFDKIKVMLTTEGTYPFHQGGVSTWCNILVQNIRDIDYVVYSIIMNPFVTQKYTLSQNSRLIRVPLWGTEEPSEHLQTPFSQVYLAKRLTEDWIIKRDFIPLFQELIQEILKPIKDPRRLGQVLVELYLYFQEYDYKKSFKAGHTWEVYKQFIREFTGREENKIAQPTVFDLVQSLGWLYRFLNVLNTPLPRVNVAHSAAAAFCGIPCVIAKLKHKTPFLLTEHGVYLREQYLSLSRRGYSSFLNTFFIRMVQSIAGLNYFYADQVSPVCRYNTRWENRFGVPDKNIKVIYNGVNKDVFAPAKESPSNKFPTVVSVARVDPVRIW